MDYINEMKASMAAVLRSGIAAKYNNARAGLKESLKFTDSELDEFAEVVDKAVSCLDENMTTFER